MIAKSTFVFALFLASTVAYGQAYVWKDSNGRTVISDTPPPSSVKIRRAIDSPPPVVVSEKPQEKVADGAKPADAPKTIADKAADFKKRQQEAKEKADKLAREQAAEANKRETCERARRYLATLESIPAVATYGENGERQLMDTAQREQEIDRARKFITDACQ